MPRRYPEYTPERIKESKSYQVLLPKFNARRWALGSSEWQDHGVDYSFEYVQDGFFHGFRLLGQVRKRLEQKNRISEIKEAHLVTIRLA